MIILTSKLTTAATDRIADLKEAILGSLDDLNTAEKYAMSTLKAANVRQMATTFRHYRAVSEKLLSYVLQLTKELETSGIQVSSAFKVGKEKKSLVDLWNMIWTTAQKVDEKAWEDAAQKQQIQKDIDTAFKLFKKTLLLWVKAYVVAPQAEQPEAIQPTAIPETAPDAGPNIDKNYSAPPAYYFEGTDVGKRKEYQGREKKGLRGDIIDALYQNRETLPDDLKGKISDLLKFVHTQKFSKTAGFLEGVYNLRTNEIKKLLQQFFGEDYPRVKPFEDSTISSLKEIWNQEFKEVSPETLADVLDDARSKLSNGEPEDKVVQDIADNLLRISKNSEPNLDRLIATGFPVGNKMYDKALEIARAKLKATPAAMAPTISAPSPVATSPTPAAIPEGEAPIHSKVYLSKPETVPVKPVPVQQIADDDLELGIEEPSSDVLKSLHK